MITFSPIRLRRCVWAAALAASAALVAAASPLAALEQSETVTRSFTLAAVDGRRTLVVDNLSGAIAIEAGSGDAVELTLTQTFVAKSTARLGDVPDVALLSGVVAEARPVEPHRATRLGLQPLRLERCRAHEPPAR